MFTPTIIHGRREARNTSRPHSITPLERDISAVFDNLLMPTFVPWVNVSGLGQRMKNTASSSEVAVPRLEMTSNEKRYAIAAELPGVSPENMTLEIKEDVLILKGEKKQEVKEENQNVHIAERSYGSFERLIGLPEDANVDEIKASHKDGVLTIMIPRKEPAQPETRNIEITVE